MPATNIVQPIGYPIRSLAAPNILNISRKPPYDPDMTLLYEFARNKNLSSSGGLGPILGITRVLATASRYNSDGILETNLVANTPRFDHDPATLLSLGLLVEEARTNVCFQARQFDTTWTLNGGLTIAQDSIGVDGVANTAWTLNDNSSSDESLRQNITIPNDSNTHSFSIYLAKDTDISRFPEVGLSLGGGTAQQGFYHINSQTGAITLRAEVGTTTGIVEDKGLFWRITISVTNNTTGNVTATLFLRPAAGTIFGTFDAAAQGTAVFDAAQLELNASFPTSFIDTTTVSVTRNADVVSTTDVSWLNASAGTLYISNHVPFVGTSTGYEAAISDGTTNERVVLLRPAGTQQQLFVADGGVEQANLQVAGLWSDGDTHRVVAAWAVNDFVQYMDGIARGTPDTSGTLPTMTQLNVGSNQVDAQLANGHIKEFRYYNVRKDNTFLEDLSNGKIAA
jgi:hypothetical protein